MAWHGRSGSEAACGEAQRVTVAEVHRPAGRGHDRGAMRRVTLGARPRQLKAAAPRQLDDGGDETTAARGRRLEAKRGRGRGRGKAAADWPAMAQRGEGMEARMARCGESGSGPYLFPGHDLLWQNS